MVFFGINAWFADVNVRIQPRELVYERVFRFGWHAIPHFTFAGLQPFFAFTFSIVDFVGLSASRNRGRDLSFLGTMPGLFFFLILLFLHGVDSGHKTRRAHRLRARFRGQDSSRSPSDISHFALLAAKDPGDLVQSSPAL